MKLPDPTTFLGDPWTSRFLLWLLPALAVATAMVCYRQSEAPWVSALPAILSAGLGALAFRKLTAAAPEGVKPPLPLIVAALGIAVVGLVLFGRDSGLYGWLVTVLPFALFMGVTRASYRWKHFVFYPLMLGCVPLATAALMGTPATGGFPAALAMLFTLVLNLTREIEVETETPEDGVDHPPVHFVHRLRLARISMVFFIFGVVSLWPWLGKIYGHAYFWVLVAGVLLPTTMYWGRLRQPRMESSYEALVRFNRLSPYLGGVLLLALALA
jgi:hypothetical protein